MAIKVKIPADVSSVKIDPLYQWDYGQTLEIESPILPSGILEVHFSCSGMTEAFVRSCSGTSGIYSVRVPDACLEQSTDITAWIYEKSTESGKTLKTITIPINERPRPNRGGGIPQSANDVYTESITEINKLIEKMGSGEIVVKAAESAVFAQSAQNAVSAESAVLAQSAQNAASAENTTTADSASYLKNIVIPTTTSKLSKKALYYIEGVLSSASAHISFGAVYWAWGKVIAIACYSGDRHELVIDGNGNITVKTFDSSGTEVSKISSVRVWKLSTDV